MPDRRNGQAGTSWDGAGLAGSAAGWLALAKAAQTDRGMRIRPAPFCEALKQRLPATTMVSIGQRPSLRKRYERQVELWLP
jgi:hypothetical protein